MDCNMPGFPVHLQPPELVQTHVHWVHDAIHYLILCRSLLLPPSIFPRIRVFFNVSSSHLVANLLELQPQHQSLQWVFRINILSDFIWFYLLAVQRTLRSLLQHHSSKASILQHSAFFISNSHIHTWLLEKPYLWLDGPLLAKSFF